MLSYSCWPIQWNRREPDRLLNPAAIREKGGVSRQGPGERDGADVSQERLMSSDQSREPLLQEESDPEPRTGGKAELS